MGTFSTKGLVLTGLPPTMAGEDGPMWQRNSYTRVLAEELNDIQDGKYDPIEDKVNAQDQS